MKKLVLVDCLSQFRIRYVVEVEDDIDHALDEVIMRENDEDFQEFSQVHLGHISTAHREISKEQYMKLFDEENGGYCESWSDEAKLRLVNKIVYDEVILNDETGC